MSDMKAVTTCIKDLEEAQDAEYDNREAVREADHFLNKRDGQWEPQIIQKLNNRPRYTFDECNPIVDDIMGEMEQMSFDIEVNPLSGDASKKLAKAYEGIIRNLEQVSGATHIYNAAARIMVGTGFAAWRVVADWRDDNSFDQDLLIKDIPDAQNTVWFDANANQQDMSDSTKAWRLISMTKQAYEEKYPKGSGQGVTTTIRQQVYTHKKPGEIMIGEYLYKKTKYRELVRMTDGSVYEVNDDFKMILDELKQQNITVNKSRKRPYHVVYQQLFDGADWLKDEKETVFSYIPIVPVYGNFRVSESKVIYWGIVEKLMDAQRVINYSESRKIEEGALAPKGKVWMNKDQAQSADVRRGLETMNTNNDPVQFYDHVEGANPPTYIGAPQSNPGLMETTQSARTFIERTSGTYDEARGNAPANRSGVAIERLQDKSDNPKRKWFTSMEIALTHTCRICVLAIPKVYDTRQTLQLRNPDGTMDKIVIKQPVVDTQTGQVVELNDLSKGTYGVACSAGPAFQSRQKETVAAINEIASIDPTIMQLGGDVLLSNINAPGIDDIAERKRKMMVSQGLIPESQLTDEEKAAVQAAQESQGNQQDPIATANLMIAQAQLEEAQGRNQERAARLDIEQQKLSLKQVEQQSKTMLDSMKLLNDQIKTQAETLKLIKDAIGADGILSREAISAFNNQARDLNQAILTS